MHPHTPSKKTVQYQQLIAGLLKSTPNLVVTIASRPYTIPQIVTILQSVVTAHDAVAGARGTLRDALLAKSRLEAESAPLVKSFVAMLRTMYGGSDDVLASLGVSPTKRRRQLTEAEIAARTLKAAATRAARRAAREEQAPPLGASASYTDPPLPPT